MLSRLKETLSEKLGVVTGSRDALTPPARLVQNIGGGDFVEAGREFMGYFIDLAKLQPSASVLDIGCGCGRMAVPLTRYLTSGSYRGFDIDPRGVAWCTKMVTPRFPNFRFEQADVYNKVYNQAGKHPASAYRFPYADRDFDFVCLTSVFTHMLWPDMANYLREIVRTLKPGGTCLCTYFLLDPHTEELLAAKKTDIDFPVASDRCRLHRADKPEWAVAFDRAQVEQLMQELGLEIQNPIHFGRWRGEGGMSYQDIIIAKKR
jgi:SAM-dependent methyltransferase